MVKGNDRERLEHLADFLRDEATSYNSKTREYHLVENMKVAHKAFQKGIQPLVTYTQEFQALEKMLDFYNVKRNVSIDYYLVCLNDNMKRIKKAVDYKDNLTTEQEQQLSLDYYKLTRDEQIAVKNYELWLNNPHLLPAHDYKNLADRQVVKTLAESMRRQFEVELEQQVGDYNFEAIAEVLNLIPFRF